MGRWADPLYRKRYTHEWYKAHKKSSNAQSLAWARAHPQRILEIHRKYQFGLSFAEQERLKGKLCGICGNRGTHIDHDHVTGKFRDVLCNTCNAGLGMFHDNLELLKKAVTYLEFHR